MNIEAQKSVNMQVNTEKSGEQRRTHSTSDMISGSISHVLAPEFGAPAVEAVCESVAEGAAAVAAEAACEAVASGIGEAIATGVGEVVSGIISGIFDGL